MRALIQRVSSASVTVDEHIVGQIGAGLLVFLGVGQTDTQTQVKALAEKIIHMRIFTDEQGKMSHSVLDTGGKVLVISQFTLYGDIRRGRRPSFTDAASPPIAEALYEHFKAELTSYKVDVESGVFGASMNVTLSNEGPVTIWLDTDVWR